MCGITGFVDFNNRSSRDILVQMAEVQRHRGPDDKGEEFFENGEAQIGLGFRRLSIIELSALGHQPMFSSDGSIAIIFNGEIYNFKELRKELEEAGEQFRSHSDTEVILKSWSRWGMKCVDRFIGMFAFAIYDKNLQKLFLCRDRAGVKPLFYYWKNGLFLFASELKSFHEHTGFEKEIDFDALALYFQHLYVPAPWCIFKNAFKLKPGHWLELDLKSREISVHKYWDVVDAYNKPRLNISFEEAAAETERLLSSAFEYRMVADVPVGIFLSGGYDSSAVAALLQKNRTQKLKTFTIGFYEDKYNEAHHAKKVAQHIGTDHFEHYCTFKEAMDIIPSLPFSYDEPFADSSAIPTTLVSRVAREQVTVALSADAGDELFAGYYKYLWVQRLTKLFSLPPRFLNRFVSGIMKSLAFLAPQDFYFYDRYHKLKRVLASGDRVQMFDLISQLMTCDEVNRMLVPETKALLNAFDEGGRLNENNDILSLALATDYKTYLVEDILQKVDRATMSVSLEGREPFLDHRLVEWTAQLPSSFKANGLTTKYILRHIVHKYIPKEIMERPKMGFSVPVESWCRNELKHYLQEYLSPSIVKKQGIFKQQYTDKILMHFFNNKPMDFQRIWSLLIFQLWYERWIDKSSFR